MVGGGQLCYVINIFKKRKVLFMEDENKSPNNSGGKKSLPNLLDRKDRMSMYSGLEVRVPFCDYRIAEYLYNVPWEYKDHDGQEKGLLREAMKDWLPEEVLRRKKSPYPKTHDPAYLTAVTERLRDILSRDTPLTDLVSVKALERLLTHADSVQWYGQLMNLPQTIAYFIQLDCWLKRFGVKICI